MKEPLNFMLKIKIYFKLSLNKKLTLDWIQLTYFGQI